MAATQQFGPPQARNDVLDGSIFSRPWIQWFQQLWQIITSELRVSVAALQASITKLTPTGYVVAVKFAAGFASHLVDGSAGTGGTTYAYAVPGLLVTDVISCVSLTSAAQTAGIGIGNARVSAADEIEIAWTCAAPAGALTVNGIYSIVAFRTPA